MGAAAKRQLSLTCSGRHNVKAKLSELRGEGLKMAGEGFSKGFKDIGFGAKQLSWIVSAWLASKIALYWRNSAPRSRGQDAMPGSHYQPS